ncbi:MAG: polysaccharide biosynthesis tyrosine autokinase [Sphingomonadales bacterium]|nr:MAG: polysaccharide biosynthesis tyrosine autokinase [Sphingomonadales bacterium]
MNQHQTPHSPGSGPQSDWIGHPDEAAAFTNAQPRGSLIELSHIRGFLFRQRFVMVGTVVLALLAGLILTLVMTPVYEAEATVRVDPEGNTIVEGQDIAPTVATNQVYQYLETLGEVIESRKMAAKVVESLSLQDRPAFMGESVDEDRPDGLSGEKWAEQKATLAAAMLQANVSAEIPFNNRIVSIRYASPDAPLAAEIANAYAESFALSDTERRLEANAYALQYLGSEIAEIREKLQDAELAANAYAKRNGIVSPSARSTASIPFSEFDAPTITATNLARINASYTDARANRLALEQRWIAIKDVPAGQISEVRESQVLQDLSAERGRVAGELANLRERYDESVPQVVELRARLAELDSEIARTGRDIKASLFNEFQVARRQEGALSAELDRVSRNTLDEQDRRVRFELLDREAGALRLQLAALMARYNEIAAAENVQAGSITLLDMAVVPDSPVSPNLLRNLLVALVLGTGLALVLAVLREVLDDRLRTLEDVETKFGVPLIGHTPFIAPQDLDEELGRTNGALIESYASIVSTLDYILPRDGQVLQFTSSQSSEGKTTTVKIIAERYAQLGRKTLLIDADLRRPSIANEYGIDNPENGFAEVVLGHCELHSALLPSASPNLDILPVGKSPPNPVDLLSSEALAEFLAKVRPHYSRIIFDTSPVMGIADAPLLSRHVDGTVFIVEANRVHYGQAKASLRRLRAVGARVCGVVLTKYRALEAGQAAGYEYRYYSYSTER